MCDHLHEQTSRYDAAARMLTFLQICPSCGIERVVETLSYDPRFKPCALPGRKQPGFLNQAATEPLRLAA